MNTYCRLELTCANRVEADKIANALLAKHLIACAKQVPVQSAYRWQGKIDQADEVLLIMDSKLDLFSEIEKEVAKVHSYDTFVLTATPLAKVSAGAKKWLDEELA